MTLYICNEHHHGSNIPCKECQILIKSNSGSQKKPMFINKLEEVISETAILLSSRPNQILHTKSDTFPLFPKEGSEEATNIQKLIFTGEQLHQALDLMMRARGILLTLGFTFEGQIKRTTTDQPITETHECY